MIPILAAILPWLYPLRRTVPVPAVLFCALLTGCTPLYPPPRVPPMYRHLPDEYRRLTAPCTRQVPGTAAGDGPQERGPHGAPEDAHHGRRTLLHR